MRDATAGPGQASTSDKGLLILALVVTAIAFALRAFAAVEPLGIDQGLWASAARGMSRGQLLYRDVWEQRPPGIYFAYLWAFKILGWKASTVAWMDLLASMATAGSLFVITRRLMGLAAGAAAAALFAVLTMPAWLYGHGGFLERSVCETFIAFAVALGAWSATRFRETASLTAAAAVGLCMGAAIIFKPNAGLYLPGLLIWMVAYRPARMVPGWRPWISPIVIMGLATSVIPALTLLWLWRLDLLHDARVAVIDFNGFYVTQGFTLSGQFIGFGDAIYGRAKTDPLWFAGSVGGLLAVVELVRRRAVSPLAGLAICWGGTSAFVIFVNGARLFNSYFIQVLPALTLMVTWLFFDWARGSRLRKSVATVVAVMMVAIMAQRSYVTRVMTSVRANIDQALGHGDRIAYLERDGNYNRPRGYSARANAELATYVRAHTTADETIYLFGVNAADVYFETDRLTAHRFLRVNFYIPSLFPNPDFNVEAVVAALQAAPPRYLIFERLHQAPFVGAAVEKLPEDPAVARLLSHYRPETVIEDFTLYRRVQ